MLFSWPRHLRHNRVAVDHSSTLTQRRGLRRFFSESNLRPLHFHASAFKDRNEHTLDFV
jgi:hypothetical protein